VLRAVTDNDARCRRLLGRRLRDATRLCRRRSERRRVDRRRDHCELLRAQRGGRAIARMVAIAAVFAIARLSNRNIKASLVNGRFRAPASVRVCTTSLLPCHKASARDREALRVAKPIGRVRREVREATGMPRSEVARKAKLDPSVVWRLENPKTGAQPSFELVSKVAAVLGVSLDDVVARLGSATARDDARPRGISSTASPRRSSTFEKNTSDRARALLFRSDQKRGRSAVGRRPMQRKPRTPDRPLGSQRSSSALRALDARVSKLRAAEGLTQQEAADQAGLPFKTAFGVESGTAKPRDLISLRVAPTIGVPVLSLID